MRFILKKKWAMENGASGETYFTLDVSVPELEECFKGGFSESAYEFVELIGVEFLSTKDGEG